MVVFVDDLQWVDAPTRRTLSYIARRLQFERVAIVSTRRAGTDAHTDTGPLDRARRRHRRRRRRHPPSTPASPAAEVRRELVAAGGGIPLVLVEAANMLDADQRAGRVDLPDPLPIGSSGQRVVDLAARAAAAGRAVGAARSPPPSPTATSCAS